MKKATCWRHVTKWPLEWTTWLCVDALLLWSKLWWKNWWIIDFTLMGAFVFVRVSVHSKLCTCWYSLYSTFWVTKHYHYFLCYVLCLPFKVNWSLLFEKQNESSCCENRWMDSLTRMSPVVFHVTVYPENTVVHWEWQGSHHLSMLACP